MGEFQMAFFVALPFEGHRGAHLRLEFALYL